MEQKNRNLWIIIAVIAAILILLCICVVAVGGVIAAFFSFPVGRSGGIAQISESSELVINVEESPTLDLDSFAGNVVVRRGEPGRIRIEATKRAMSEAALNRIDLDMFEDDDGVVIRTSHTGAAAGNLSAAFDIVVPPDTQLEMKTGAGNIEVVGVEGEIAAQTGAGDVTVQDVVAPVKLETGAGNIEYEGEPSGMSTFNTGAGNIRLHLSADANVELDLSVGVGNIRLGGFDVEGDVGSRDVEGVIGTGEGAVIEADTAVGDITLVQQ
ncbi:MAG: DUF4097 family beta strand repeat-containing protein [Anaerolineae bacterium]